MTTGTISEQTAQECFDTLRGFDEIAISKAFGRDVLTLSKADRGMFGRSLAFTALRRSGCNDTTAFERAMDMTITEVTEVFRSDDPPATATDAEAFADLDADAEGEASSPG